MGLEPQERSLGEKYMVEISQRGQPPNLTLAVSIELVCNEERTTLMR
jgi:hypothetical protein